MIVWLNVPFSQKDSARRKGAQWSIAHKKWYVEDVEDLMPFYQWMDSRLKRPTTSRVPERPLTPDEMKKRDRKKAHKQKRADAIRERAEHAKRARQLPQAPDQASREG